MLLKKLRELGTRLAHCFSRSSSQNAGGKTSDETAPEYDVAPLWHGDHWQNLLSSPMDARHYVMEDWGVAPELEVAPVANMRRRSH